MSLGSIIRKERLNKKISIKEFAQKIRVSDAFISRLERDDVMPPKEEKMILIAKILDLDVDHLYALAKRTPKTITNSIAKNPKYISFFRTIDKLDNNAFEEVFQYAINKKTKENVE